MTLIPPQEDGADEAGSASGSHPEYPTSNTVDGDARSYWESTNHVFPQSLTVDLGTARSVSRLVLKLPPDPAWGVRTQTIAVSASSDGSSYTTVVGVTDYHFDPATGNTVTVTFPATTARYLRLTVTGNTGWPAAQASEVEIYTR